MNEALQEKWDDLADKPYRKHLAWILNFDFYDMEGNECRKNTERHGVLSKEL